MVDITDSYIDDILVDQTVVPVRRVLEQHGRFGQMAKSPESLSIRPPVRQVRVR